MSGSSVKFRPEPERYEFTAAPMHHFELTRRDFFKFLGGGISVFVVARDTLATQETAPIVPPYEIPPMTLPATSQPATAPATGS